MTPNEKKLSNTQSGRLEREKKKNREFRDFVYYWTKISLNGATFSMRIHIAHPTCLELRRNCFVCLELVRKGA